MTLQLFSVNHYGWTWKATDPSPSLLARDLVRIWSDGSASELRRRVPGRREVSA